MDFRQLVKFQGVHWQKYSGHSPIGEIPRGILAKVQWTFANGEGPFGESLFGEIPQPPMFVYVDVFLLSTFSSFFALLMNRLK
jgi:hypothetical protein